MKLKKFINLTKIALLGDKFSKAKSEMLSAMFLLFKRIIYLLQRFSKHGIKIFNIVVQFLPSFTFRLLHFGMYMQIGKNCCFLQKLGSKTIINILLLVIHFIYFSVFDHVDAAPSIHEISKFTL